MDDDACQQAQTEGREQATGERSNSGQPPDHTSKRLARASKVHLGSKPRLKPQLTLRGCRHISYFWGLQPGTRWGRVVEASGNPACVLMVLGEEGGGDGSAPPSNGWLSIRQVVPRHSVAR